MTLVVTKQKRGTNRKLRAGRAPESGTDTSFFVHRKNSQPKAGVSLRTAPIRNTGSYPERIRFRHDCFGDLAILSAILRIWFCGKPVSIRVAPVIRVD